jgi:hypothetical protein
MSRSRRKTPVIGITTCRSERSDKVIWHGRMRAKEREALAHGDDPPTVNAVSDVWTMGKDGRQRCDPKSKWMRK